MRLRGACEGIAGRAGAAATRWAPFGVILAYHRVATPRLDPQLLSVAPDRFADHLSVITSLGQAVSLRDMVRACAVNRVPRRAVVITFDDGYADNLRAAEPLLRAAALPATVFVTTGGAESGQPFWWDELEALLLRSRAAPPRLAVDCGGRRREWSLDASPLEGEAPVGSWDVTQPTDPTPRHAAYRALTRICRALPPHERAAVIAQVAAQFRVAARPDEHARLTPDEVAELAASDVVEVGAHGVWHAPLSVLSAEQQRDELWQGRRTLGEWCGRPIDLLSYPFGARDDLSPECVRLARDSGYMAACANWPGPVFSWSHPYRLPRYLVRDWCAAEFEERLEGWLIGDARLRKQSSRDIRSQA